MELIIKSQESHTQNITKLSQDVPITFLNGAKDIVKKFKEFKTEIDADIAEIVEKINAVKQKLTNNKYDKEARKGFLSNSLEEYFACFGAINT